MGAVAGVLDLNWHIAAWLDASTLGREHAKPVAALVPTCLQLVCFVAFTALLQRPCMDVLHRSRLLHPAAGCWRSWRRCEHTAAVLLPRHPGGTAQQIWRQRWPACSGAEMPACPTRPVQQRRRLRLQWVQLWWRSRRPRGRPPWSGDCKPSSRWGRKGEAFCQQL